MTARFLVHLEVDEPFAPRVNGDELVAVAQLALDEQARPGSELTILVTDDETVRELNRTYRGMDAPTDVLSFASHDAADQGNAHFIAPPDVAAMLDAHLGDIVIAFPYAERQAARFGNGVQAELRLLTAHGVLHLLGYDHDSDDAEAAMWAKQESILRTFGDQRLARRVYPD